MVMYEPRGSVDVRSGRALPDDTAVSAGPFYLGRIMSARSVPPAKLRVRIIITRYVSSLRSTREAFPAHDHHSSHPGLGRYRLWIVELPHEP